MKLGILSDIHGNLPALQACLDVMDNENVSRIICLGDTVGYGPSPNECLDILRKREIPSVLGNHDAGVINRVSLRMFREPNASLLQWTRKSLSYRNKKYLAGAPLLYKEDNWIMAHASPLQPERWNYLNSAVTCRNILRKLPQTVCFVGHTHIPGVVANEIGVLNVQQGYKFIINPGSVGQSRDEDYRASFGIFDFDAFTYKNYRIPYPIEETLSQFRYIHVEEETARNLLHYQE